MTYPLFVQSPRVHDADQMRIYTAAHLVPSLGASGVARYSGRGGVRPGPTVAGAGPLQVTATPTASMQVIITSGVAFIESTRPEINGVYVCPLKQDALLTIGASDPTNPRIDAVVMHAKDIAIGTDTNAAAVEVIPGTPNASPTVPVLPSQSLLLATVRVDAAVSSVTAAKITDQRAYTVAAGGVLPYAADTGRPPAVFGQVGANRATNRLEWSDANGAWQQLLTGAAAQLLGWLAVGSVTTGTTTPGAATIAPVAYTVPAYTGNYSVVHVSLHAGRSSSGAAYAGQIKVDNVLSGAFARFQGIDQTIGAGGQLLIHVQDNPVAGAHTSSLSVWLSATGSTMIIDNTINLVFGLPR